MTIVHRKEIANELGIKESLLDDLRAHAGLHQKNPGYFELEIVRGWRNSMSDGGSGGGRYIEELLSFRKPSTY